jgi:dipeptidyl aminopeptidase/acylaminoacyl peptidase
VAFEWAADKNDNHDIYVTLVGSRDVRRLTTHPAADFAPSWSPSGRQIAFLRTDNGATRIRVMSALGGPDRVVSDFPAWSTISWSPDARFHRRRPYGGRRSRRGNLSRARLGRRTSGDRAFAGANRHPERPGSIRVLNRTTGRDRPWAVVADAENAFLWDLAISPDGTSLLYDRLNFRANLWMLENFR